MERLSLQKFFSFSQALEFFRQGGRLPYKMDEDARQKFWRKPLKETNLGVAQPQPSFNP